MTIRDLMVAIVQLRYLLVRRKSDPSLAIAYRRVSPRPEGGELGLEAQRDQIEAWARRDGVTILASYEDRDVSGGSPLARRPALLDALADLRSTRAGILVVAKRDRIARDVAIALEITRAVNLHGAMVVAADGVGNGTDAHAKLQRTMIDAFAEHERSMIGARTAAALARKRARGEKTGGWAPYGYDASEGRLVARDDEQAVIELIRTLRQVDGLTIAQIVRSLQLRGVVNREGKHLHRTSVDRILKMCDKVRDVA